MVLTTRVRTAKKPIKKTKAKGKRKPLTREDVDRARKQSEERIRKREENAKKLNKMLEKKSKPKNGLKPGQRKA